MAVLAVTNTLANGQTPDASLWNTNYSDIVNYINNRYNGTDTWLNMKVSGTAANPAEIKSSNADCEFDIDSTGSNGTPRVSWKRSGTAYFTLGVDGAASNALKLGTTSLTTNVALQIPTTGVQVQVAVGSAATPPLSFIGRTNDGMFSFSSHVLGFATNGTQAVLIDGNQCLQISDGALATPSLRFINSSATGIYLGGPDIMAFVSNGIEHFEVGVSSPFVAFYNMTLTTGASTATFTNSPVAGNPTTWMQIKVNGNNKYIPCF